MNTIGPCDYVVFRTGYTSRLLSWRKEADLEEVIPEWESLYEFREEEKWITQKIYGPFTDEDDAKDAENDADEARRYAQWLEEHHYTDNGSRWREWYATESIRVFRENAAKEAEDDQLISEMMLRFLHNRGAIFVNDKLADEDEKRGLTLIGKVGDAEDILNTPHADRAYSPNAVALRDFDGTIAFKCGSIGWALQLVRKLKKLGYCANLDVSAVYKIVKLTTPAGKTVLLIEIDSESG